MSREKVDFLCDPHGEGPKRATVIFVGEQPGEQDEQAGHPFVGPADKLLNAALERVRIIPGWKRRST